MDSAFAISSRSPDLEGSGVVTVSMRVMIARDGYKHLLRTVAAKDDDREPTP